MRDRPIPPDTLTPWLPAAETPVHEGVYRRRAPGGRYSCWSGDQWFGDAATPASAAAQRRPSQHQRAPWRGLGAAPAAPCWACRGHTVIDGGYDEDGGRDLISECPDC